MSLGKNIKREMCNKMIYNITAFILEYFPISNWKFQQCENCNYVCII